VKIAIQNLQKKIPVSSKKLKKLVLEVLQLEKIKTPGQLNFYFVNDGKIRELNLRYRSTDCATDVLSFDISLPRLRRGRRAKQIYADIVISVDAAGRNANEFNTSLQYELNLYIIHGILHLFGYDDAGAENKRIMQNRQDALIKALKKYAPA
jgi:probable rRNA maturation factor